MEETVDLRNIKVGDTVHFRCGGQVKVVRMIRKLRDPYGYGLFLEGESCVDERADRRDTNLWYQACGSLTGTAVHHPFDIVRITTALFCWSDVKPGMAFKLQDGAVCFFVAHDPSNKEFVIIAHDDSASCGFDEVDLMPRVFLTRAPEHDITIAG